MRSKVNAIWVSGDIANCLESAELDGGQYSVFYDKCTVFYDKRTVSGLATADQSFNLNNGQKKLMPRCVIHLC